MPRRRAKQTEAPRKRKVVTRSGEGMRGYFPSFKNPKPIPWESLLERTALLVFEFDPKVLALDSYQIEVTIDGPEGAFSTFPDIITWDHAPKSHLWEVKPNRKAADPRIASRLRWAKDFLESQGQLYDVLLGKDLLRQPRLDLLNELVHYRRRFERDRLRELPAYRTLCAGERLLTLGQLASEVGSWNEVVRMCANSLLLFNPDQPLTPDLTAQPIQE